MECRGFGPGARVEGLGLGTSDLRCTLTPKVCEIIALNP